MAWTKIRTEKFNQNYRGEAELAEFVIEVPLPEQMNSAEIADKAIQGSIEEVQKQGGTLLEVHVWEDTSPTWNTKYYIRIVASEGSTGGIGALPLVWAVIIIGVIAVLAIVGLTYFVTKSGEVLEYIGEQAGGFGISLALMIGVGMVGIGTILLLRRR